MGLGVGVTHMVHRGSAELGGMWQLPSLSSSDLPAPKEASVVLKPVGHVHQAQGRVKTGCEQLSLWSIHMDKEKPRGQWQMSK